VYATGQRQVVQADDWITKFQGTWVSAQGKMMFVQARYVAWVIFAFVFPVVMAVDYVFTGTVSLVPLTDASIAVLVTYGIANLTNGEVTLAHAGVYGLRWGRQLSDRVRARTRRRPETRVCSDRLRVHLLPPPDSIVDAVRVDGPLPGRDGDTAAYPARTGE
jgi:hypothetical protein